MLKEQLEPDQDSSLQYEGPDFVGKLTSLVDIEELPQKSCCSPDFSSAASTETLPDVSSPERLSRWPPGPFQIPNFAFDVELILGERNAEFENIGKLLHLTRDQKQDISEKNVHLLFMGWCYLEKLVN